MLCCKRRQVQEVAGEERKQEQKKSIVCLSRPLLCSTVSFLTFQERIVGPARACRLLLDACKDQAAWDNDQVLNTSIWGIMMNDDSKDRSRKYEGLSWIRQQLFDWKKPHRDRYEYLFRYGASPRRLCVKYANSDLFDILDCRRLQTISVFADPTLSPEFWLRLAVLVNCCPVLDTLELTPPLAFNQPEIQPDFKWTKILTNTRVKKLVVVNRGGLTLGVINTLYGKLTGLECVSIRGSDDGRRGLQPLGMICDSPAIMRVPDKRLLNVDLTDPFWELTEHRNKFAGGVEIGMAIADRYIGNTHVAPIFPCPRMHSLAVYIRRTAQWDSSIFFSVNNYPRLTTVHVDWRQDAEVLFGHECDAVAQISRQAPPQIKTLEFVIRKTWYNRGIISWALRLVATGTTLATRPQAPRTWRIDLMPHLAGPDYSVSIMNVLLDRFVTFHS